MKELSAEWQDMELKVQILASLQEEVKVILKGLSFKVFKMQMDQPQSNGKIQLLEKQTSRIEELLKGISSKMDLATQYFQCNDIVSLFKLRRELELLQAKVAESEQEAREVTQEDFLNEIIKDEKDERNLEL
jgi:hypothetical protein